MKTSGPVIMSALFGAAVIEGAVAAGSAAVGGAGFVGATWAGLAAFVLLVGLGIVPAIGAVVVLSLPSTRRLGRAVGDAFVGRFSAAVLLAMAAALTVAAGFLIGPKLIGAMSPSFAAVAQSLVTLAVFVSLVCLVATLGHAGGFAERHLLEPLGRFQTTVFVLVATLAVGGVVAALLPISWAGAIVGAGCGAAIAFFSQSATWTRVLAVISLLLIIGGVAALTNVDGVPYEARASLTYKTPYAGNLVTLIWKWTDDDGDGFSDVLGGGDCDDANDEVFPGAIDISNNGIDENCTGSDAPTYERPAAPTARPPTPAPQNIVIIQIDALRPDHVGFNGYARPTTPRLDQFREESVVYQNAYTIAPSTRFAMAGMFTGDDPRRVPHDDLGGNRYRLRPQARTVAEDLRQRSYETIGLTISYVIHHNLGTGQGFRVWRSPWPVDEWRRYYETAAEETTEKAIASLEELEKNKKFLLFTHYRCTHDPYFKYDRWDFGDEPMDRYDSALAYCDDEIGKLFDHLAERDDYANTAVIVLSDHGELFGDHNLTSHGNSLYEPDVRVLLMMRAAGIEGGQTVVTPVSLLDLAPTVLELSGKEPGPMDGVSLFAHLAPDVDLAPRPLFMFTDVQRGNVRYTASAILEWPHKLIRDTRTGDVFLFNVAVDPAESQPIANDDLSSALAEQLDGYQGYARQ